MRALCITITCLLVSAFLGCSQQAADPDSTEPPAEATNAEPAESAVTLGVSTYSVTNGSYEQGTTHEAVNADTLKTVFSETNWEHADERPSLKLTEWRDDSFTMLQVSRNQTETGELKVAWVGFANGKKLEGDSTKIETPEVLLELMLAFIDGSDLSAMIEWDILE